MNGKLERHEYPEGLERIVEENCPEGFTFLMVTSAKKSGTELQPYTDLNQFRMLVLPGTSDSLVCIYQKNSTFEELLAEAQKGPHEALYAAREMLNLLR